MSRPAAGELSPLGKRLALIIERAALDLRFTRMSHAAEYAAVRALAEPEIADGLRARAVLAAIDTMHERREWHGSNGQVVVCDRCNEPWPCETKRLVDGAQTPAAGGCGGSASPAAGHQPEWDGNRCANCNTPLSEGGPCPMAAEPATDELEAVR